MTNDTNVRGTRAALRRVAPAVLAARFETMMRQAAGTREGSDPEALHDMRVASRRLRAALDAFAPLYGGGAFRRAMRETKTLTRALGAVRDDDVLLDTLRTYAESVPQDEAAAVARFVERIAAGREAHRATLLHDLDALDAGGYAKRFGKAMEAPEKGKAGREHADDAGRRIVAGQVAAFYALAPHIEHPDHVEELHEMRIAAKRLRYALELFAEPLGAGTGPVLAAVREFQEIVGEIHDADVRVALLTDYLHTRATEHAHALAALAAEAAGADAAKERAWAAGGEWTAESVALVAAIARTAATRRERYAQLRDRWDGWEAAGLHARMVALAHGKAAQSA